MWTPSFIRVLHQARVAHPPTTPWREVVNDLMDDNWDGEYARINVMALRNRLPGRDITTEVRQFIEVDSIRYGWDCALDKERENWVCIPVDTQEPALRNRSV